MIHKTAIIDPKAQIGKNVEVGPYVVIEKDVKIATGVKIMAHSYICSGTEIGEECNIHMGCVLGNIPQDLSFKNGVTFLKIGKRNTFREHSTAHRGTKDGSSTTIGDDNYIMNGSHIAHNCCIGNKNILAAGVLLAGYVTLEDEVFISGNSAVHQFSAIGRLAIVAGNTRVDKDVPPYMLVIGDSLVRSLNTVGLKRSTLSENAKKELKTAYKILYRSNLNTSQALKELEKLASAEAKHLVSFIKNSKRGICPGPRD